MVPSSREGYTFSYRDLLTVSLLDGKILEASVNMSNFGWTSQDLEGKSLPKLIKARYRVPAV